MSPHAWCWGFAASVGWSTLQRGDDGVLATFSANEIPPSHAVTLWWVVFNDPENCSAPGCGEDDIFVDGDPTAGLNDEGIAVADIVAGYAGGTVASPDGHVLLSGGLDVDEIGPETIMGEGAMLKDVAGAEIHLVLRSHGPAIEGLTEVQTTSYGGGCETMLSPPEIAEAKANASICSSRCTCRDVAADGATLLHLNTGYDTWPMRPGRALCHGRLTEFERSTERAHGNT